MAYSELIKNFSRIREYMREFYVYGFKSREEYTGKSARSYDDERRRIESWLGEYMGFHQTSEGKNVFLSIDSRLSKHNPLFSAWKTKSFTDGDITLHFILFDILNSPEISLSLNEIAEKTDEYICNFAEPRMFDLSTIRKKLNEYIKEGIIIGEKKGRTMYYHRSKYIDFGNIDTLNFFSEVAPCGVVGSFLLDKSEIKENNFSFKHHYITGTMDSEIVCSLFIALNEKCYITIETLNKTKDKILSINIVPLKFMSSVQSGRQYIMAFVPDYNKITSFRVDKILSVKQEDICDNFDELQSKLNNMLPHIWGVSTRGRGKERMEHVEFTVKYSSDEMFVHNRLEREKRCGTVEKLSLYESKFSADVYDSSEMIPWIRTFIGRIKDIHFSNKELEKTFLRDIEQMKLLYNIKDGDSE